MRDGSGEPANGRIEVRDGVEDAQCARGGLVGGESPLYDADARRVEPHAMRATDRKGKSRADERFDRADMTGEDDRLVWVAGGELIHTSDDALARGSVAFTGGRRYVRILLPGGQELGISRLHFGTREIFPRAEVLLTEIVTHYNIQVQERAYLIRRRPCPPERAGVEGDGMKGAHCLGKLARLVFAPWCEWNVGCAEVAQLTVSLRLAMANKDEACRDWSSDGGESGHERAVPPGGFG